METPDGESSQSNDVSETTTRSEQQWSLVGGLVDGGGLVSSRAISNEHLTPFHPPSPWPPEAGRGGASGRALVGWREHCSGPHVSHRDGYGENNGAVSDKLGPPVGRGRPRRRRSTYVEMHTDFDAALTHTWRASLDQQWIYDWAI